MQSDGSFGGPIGPFPVPGVSDPVPATASGIYTVDSQEPVDLAALGPQINAALLYALNQVIAQKLASNQVAVPTLQQSLPYYLEEIAAASGIANLGLRLVELQTQVDVLMPAPAFAPYTGPLPPSPTESMKNAFAQQARDRLDPRNYEVKATMNVGGIKVKASTDKGLDTQGIKDQVVDKAKSTIIWWAIGCVILFVVGILLAGLAGFIWYTVAHG